MNPNNLGKSVEIKATNRPIRVAYIIPNSESPENHMIVDAIFHESYTRWAGAYTLIIPSTESMFTDSAYESWLEFFDPDFVYTYVDINEDLTQIIDDLCSPIAILKHSNNQALQVKQSWQQFIPKMRHYFNPVSSMTMLHTPHAQYPFFVREENETTVITQYYGSPIDHFISDNFGTAFDTEIITNEIPGLFKTLCLVPQDLPDNIITGSERCTSIKEIISRLNHRKATPISRLAMACSESIPRVEPYQWARSFNIFIGKSILDRINFWNARHFSPSHSLTLGAFIIKKEFFDDPDQVTALGKYLSNNNFTGGNGIHQVSIFSYSHPKDDLESIKNLLKKNTHNSVYVGDNYNSPALPQKHDFENSYQRGSNDSHTFKVTEDKNSLLAKEPAHFSYILPKYKGMAKGQWIVDLSIERHNNLSKYSNIIDKWALPRRKKITQAFTKNLSKVNKNNQIAILPSTDNFPFINHANNSDNYYDLYLPNDEIFFRHLLLDLFSYPGDDLRKSLLKNNYKNISISDKGQNLRGVISMFGSLSDSYNILTNRFWRTVLRNANQSSVKHLIFDKNKLESHLPKDRETKDRLMRDFHFENTGELLKFMRNNLYDTLEYLVRINIFHQVHQWRCKYCGHTNSRSFDHMKIKNICDICETKYMTPIDLEWEYQLNDFIYRSLVTHSGLPVLWTIGFLQDASPTANFWYLPEIDLHDDIDKNEIDICCILDGKFYAIEVKTIAYKLINDAGMMDAFINKINRINPDIAMLSIERLCDQDKDIDEAKELLKISVDYIKKGLTKNIKLEIIIANEIKEFVEHPANIGELGKRSRSILN